MERFWSKVSIVEDESSCWLWKASCNPAGYGRFRYGDEARLAHRVAWILTYGDFNPDLVVCHKCDNPKCVRPGHLFLGTHNDNVQDKIRKGREVVLKGERCGRAKVTDLQARQMRNEYLAGGITQHALALRYGIDDSQVCRIINRKSFRET